MQHARVRLFPTDRSVVMFSSEHMKGRECLILCCLQFHTVSTWLASTMRLKNWATLRLEDHYFWDGGSMQKPLSSSLERIVSGSESKKRFHGRRG